MIQVIQHIEVKANENEVKVVPEVDNVIIQAPEEDKRTIGVNVFIPKEDYKRLQNLRMDLGAMPLRALCLQLVLEGLNRYEQGL